jgi:hypothetical protein
MKGLRTLPDTEPTLGSAILQDLAVRHLLAGHTQEYRALMPADGPADHADRLLRDLKALTLGKGEVVTAPARQAVSEKGTEPPPGIRVLLPDAARKNWRSPMQSSASAGLSPLDKATAAGQTLRSRIETDLKSERITQGDRAKEARGRIESAQRRLQERDEADGKRFAEIEAELGRPLKAMEKVRVRQLAARKQTNRQIVAVLKNQADPKVPRP